MVAKVDEENAAMISHAVHPTGKANGLSGVGLAESGTGVAVGARPEASKSGLGAAPGAGSGVAVRLTVVRGGGG